MNTTHTPAVRADTPESLERPVQNGGACTPPVPAPRDGEHGARRTPPGTVDVVAPVPAGGHRKCQAHGCHAGMIRVSYMLFRDGPIRYLLLDCPDCDGTGLDLASYAPGGAGAPSCPPAPPGLPAGGAS